MGRIERSPMDNWFGFMKPELGGSVGCCVGAGGGADRAITRCKASSKSCSRRVWAAAFWKDSNIDGFWLMYPTSPTTPISRTEAGRPWLCRYWTNASRKVLAAA
jgi:hypothetical protein